MNEKSLLDTETIKIIQIKNSIFVSIFSDISLHNQHLIRDDILKNMKNEAVEIILDMSRVDFIDSSGLGMLAFLNQEIVKKDKKLRLRSLTDNVFDIMKLGCFEQIIPIEN